MATFGVEESAPVARIKPVAKDRHTAQDFCSRTAPLGGCRCEFLPILTMHDEGRGAAPVELTDPQFNLGKVFDVWIDRGHRGKLHRRQLETVRAGP